MTFNSIRKDRLTMARNFALYYGFGEMDRLSRYDLVIIEPKAVTAPDIDYLVNHKTLVLTYLSVMEVHPDEPIFSQLEDQDFLKVDGEKVFNQPFGTYVVDLRSKRWLKHLKMETHYRLVMMRTDGLFLDTIAEVESHRLPKSVQEVQQKAVLAWLEQLRKDYPQHLLVQNNGLEQLCLHSAKFLDGIMWENPPFGLKESREWVKWIMNRIENLAEQYNLRLFLLFEENVERERRSYAFAKPLEKEKNVLTYLAPSNYVSGVTPL